MCSGLPRDPRRKIPKSYCFLFRVYLFLYTLALQAAACLMLAPLSPVLASAFVNLGFNP